MKSKHHLKKIKHHTLRIIAEIFVPMVLLYANLIMSYLTKSQIESNGIDIQKILTELSTPEMLLVGIIGSFITFVLLEFIGNEIEKGN